MLIDAPALISSGHRLELLHTSLNNSKEIRWWYYLKIASFMPFLCKQKVTGLAPEYLLYNPH